MTLGIVSCGSEESSTSYQTDNAAKTEKEISDVNIVVDKMNDLSTEEFYQSLIGKHWGAETFFSKIEETKSIYEHRNIETKHQLLGLYFTEDISQLRGYGTHEGGHDSKLAFLDGVLTSTESFLDAHFTVEVESNQLVLKYNDNTHNVFRPITSIHTELAKILLNGTYKDDKTNKEIIFDAKESTLKGIRGKNHYEFVYDFVEGLEFDVVLISEDDGHSRFQKGNIYHYQARNDTINLYRLEGKFPDDLPYRWDKENPTYVLMKK